jgi:membrane protease YdiL (CAAX protease family)
MDLFPSRDVPLPGEIAPAGAVADRPPRAAGRGRALFEVFLCSGLPTQVLVSAALVLGGIASRDADDGLSLVHVAILSLVDSALVMGLVVFFLRAGGERPRDVLLGRRWWLVESLLGIGLVPIVFLLVAVAAVTISAVAPWLHQPHNPLAALLNTRAGLIVFAVVGVVAGGLREELQRAFVLHRFEQRLGGAALGLVLFSLVFGAGHALQGWAVVVMTGLLGVFWGLTYLARRSVVAPVVCHSLFNLLEIVGLGVLK